MKKTTYAVPTVTVRGDVMSDTLGFKLPCCGETRGRLQAIGSDLSFGL